MGRPLNPTPPGFPSFDTKTFNEVRPGMILWVLLNISCACEQYVRNGKVFDSMWLVLAFEFLYTADAVFQEVSRPSSSRFGLANPDGSVCNPEPNGHHNRRFRVHAGLR